MSGQPLHIVRRFPCGGGMQAILERHRDRGETVVAISGEPAQDGKLIQLGVQPGTPLREAARRLRAVLEEHPGADCLFYNACGVEWLPPYAKEGRRFIAYLHSDYPCFSRWLARLLPGLDGCLCVDERIEQAVTALAPGRRDFVHTVPLPVDPVLPGTHSPRGPDAPLVIGYAGRIETAQKRLDRLPAFLKAMDDAGLDYRMEILGEGSYLPQLRSRLAGQANVLFLGHRSAASYWQVLAGWKYILFLSDYEGLPIALLEGIASGAVPVYPQMQQEARWIRQLSASGIYPLGDARAAAGKVAELESRMDAQAWQQYHETARQLVGEHTVDAYHRSMDAALAAIGPPARPPGTRKASLPGWAPFWLHNRLRRYRQFGTLRPVGGI